MAKRVTHIRPYDVTIDATDEGMDITARAAMPAGGDATYVIHLPWNGWAALLLKALADVVAKKVNLQL